MNIPNTSHPTRSGPWASFTALTLLVSLLAIAGCLQGGSLHKAAKNGDVETLRALIAEGVDLNVQDNLGSTALHLAVRGGHVEAATLLLENGAGIDIRDAAGNTPLHIAVQMAQTPAAFLLIDHGADPNAAEKIWKRTPLHFVSQLGPAEVAEHLIKNGGNVNARDNLGDTPLHYAALSNHLDVAKILLRRGADPTVPGQDPFTRAPGTTPLSLAKEGAMRELLKKHLNP